MDDYDKETTFHNKNKLNEISNKIIKFRPLSINDYHKEYVKLLNHLSLTEFTSQEFENYVKNIGQ